MNEIFGELIKNKTSKTIKLRGKFRTESKVLNRMAKSKA